MAICLEKGQKVDLAKVGGLRLANFCVGCSWSCIEWTTSQFFGFKKNVERFDIDLDLSCVLFNIRGEIVDHIYSPEYRMDFLNHYNLPPGKLDSNDLALHHSGDDREGNKSGKNGTRNGLDNEIITVDLKKLHPNIHQIFFFLNNVGPQDFSMIPRASIRMYEGTPHAVHSVFAQFDVTTSHEFKGKRSLIMGKLQKWGSTWHFSAIGNAHNDKNLCETIWRIAQHYVR